MHYEHLFDENKHNNNKVWKIINDIINYKTKKLGSIPEIIIDSNKLQSNRFNINCAFNEYFANNGAKMASVISPKDMNKTLLPSLPESLFLTPITEQEIITQLNILNPNKSTAVNDIPIKFIKLSTCVLAPILTSLYNRCLTEGNLPQVLKVAPITPIYKKGNKKTCSNYRPISLLFTFSKILENCVYFRLSSFLSDHCLITDSQCGFRPGFSTSDAISDLHNEILANLDQKNNVCCTFLDLAKAFDTVDHSVLLKKLPCYGIRGIALQLIESFLDNRKQYTVVKNVCSLFCHLWCSTRVNIGSFLVYNIHQRFSPNHKFQCIC